MSDDPEVKRDEKGRWAEGTKPGPGRPEGSISLVTVLKRRLRNHPEEQDAIVATLIEMATDRSDPRALQAVTQAFDRIDGTAKRAPEDAANELKVLEIQRSGSERTMLLQCIKERQLAGDEQAVAVFTAQLERLEADGE